MYHLTFENFIFDRSDVRMWVAGNNNALIRKHGEQIAHILKDVSDFFDDVPLLAMPIPEKQANGEILHNVFLLKPEHIIYEAPDVFAINAKFITEFSGFKMFFTDPKNCIYKIMNLDVLQVLAHEKKLHIIGVYGFVDKDQKTKKRSVSV